MSERTEDSQSSRGELLLLEMTVRTIATATTKVPVAVTFTVARIKCQDQPLLRTNHTLFDCTRNANIDDKRFGSSDSIRPLLVDACFSGESPRI